MRKIKKIKSYYVGKNLATKMEKKCFFPDDKGLKIWCVKESIREEIQVSGKHNHNKN